MDAMQSGNARSSSGIACLTQCTVFCYHYVRLKKIPFSFHFSFRGDSSSPPTSSLWNAGKKYLLIGGRHLGQSPGNKTQTGILHLPIQFNLILSSLFLPPSKWILNTYTNSKHPPPPIFVRFHSFSFKKTHALDKNCTLLKLSVETFLKLPSRHL